MPPLEQGADMPEAIDAPLHDSPEADPPADDGDAPQHSDAEARARAMGWRPESEWDEERAEREGRRKPSRFLTAEEFIEQTEASAPMMRQQLRKMTEKLASTESRVSDMHQILLDQKRMSQEAQQRAFERGLAQAKAEMRRAVEEGDVDAYDRAQAKAEQITRQAQEQQRAPEPDRQQEQAAPPVDPAIEQWVAQNNWFRADSILNAVMIEEHKALRARNPRQDLWDSLEDAAAIVKRRFPERFGVKPQAQRGSGAVTSPSGQRADIRGGNSIDARFARVPKADQDAYHRQAAMFEAQGMKYTKEQFLKEYEQ